MELRGHVVLLTGGSSGIGLALAERLLKAGNRVVVTGRREPLLAKAREALPGLETIVSDAGSATDREKLAAEVKERFPIDVLINNAGIQNKHDAAKIPAWDAVADEIRINLEGPIHLTSLLLPLLHQREQAWVCNVSSGLAFAPMAAMPIYCATKAALHSYTLSLRHALRATSVKVVEIIPPAVHSNLGGKHDFGVPTDEYADSVMAGLGRGDDEVTYQFSAKASQGSRADHDAMFKQMNNR